MLAVTEVPLAIRARMGHMRDGASAHFSRAARHVLSSTYQDRWIGRGRLTVWPPRPTDSDHLDFYLWGHLKTVVNAAPVDNG
jgi:hypothetical protein